MVPRAFLTRQNCKPGALFLPGQLGDLNLSKKDETGPQVSFERLWTATVPKRNCPYDNTCTGSYLGLVTQPSRTGPRLLKHPPTRFAPYSFFVCIPVRAARESNICSIACDTAFSSSDGKTTSSFSPPCSA